MKTNRNLHDVHIAEQANTLVLLIQENNPILSLWCDFYTRLASHIAHVAHSHANLQALFNEQNSYKLLPYLEELAPIAPAWQMQILSPLQSLVLLPYEVLWKICTFSALAIHRDLILKMIKKEDVLALHELVGKEGWNFVMRKSYLYKAERLALTFRFPEKTPVQYINNTALCIRKFCLKGITSALQKQVYTLFPSPEKQIQEQQTQQFQQNQKEQSQDELELLIKYESNMLKYDNIHEHLAQNNELVDLLEKLTMQILHNEVEPIWKEYLS